MKRLLFVLVTLIFIQQARAQLQQNSAINACSFPMEPAAAAYQPEDEVDRLKRERKGLKSQMKSKQKQMDKIDEKLRTHRDAIDKRLQPDLASRAIEHMELKGSRADYFRDCSPESAPSVGSTDSDVPVSSVTKINNDRAPAADAPPATGDVEVANPDATAPTQVAPAPNPQCSGEVAVVWSRNIQEDGRVNSGICAERNPRAIRPNSSSAARACQQAINDYYNDFEKRRKLENELKALRENEEELEEEIDYAKDNPGGSRRTEAARCPDGNCSGSGGMKTSSIASSLLGMVVPLAQVYGDYRAKQNAVKAYKQVETYRTDRCAELGYPSFMCSQQRPPGQFVNYQGHSQVPYASPMPGYMGSYGGQYGAVPGAFGPGAFMCNPGGFNGMGAPMLNYPGGQDWSSQINNLGPHQFAGVNPGMGPWGGPTVAPNPGAGIDPFMPYPTTPGANNYNPLLLNQELQLINSRLGGTYNGGNPILPYPNNTGGGQNIPPGYYLPGPGQPGGGQNIPPGYYLPVGAGVQPQPWGVGGSFNYTNGNGGGYLNGVIRTR